MKLRILEQQGETSGGKLNRAELSDTQPRGCQNYSVFKYITHLVAEELQLKAWWTASPSGFFSIINPHHWNQMGFCFVFLGRVEEETIFFLFHHVNNKPTRQELMRECRWGFVSCPESLNEVVSNQPECNTPSLPSFVFTLPTLPAGLSPPFLPPPLLLATVAAG